jgi:hypothetical protein
MADQNLMTVEDLLRGIKGELEVTNELLRKLVNEAK